MTVESVKLVPLDAVLKPHGSFATSGRNRSSGKRDDHQDVNEGLLNVGHHLVSSRDYDTYFERTPEPSDYTATCRAGGPPR